MELGIGKMPSYSFKCDVCNEIVHMTYSMGAEKNPPTHYKGVCGGTFQRMYDSRVLSKEKTDPNHSNYRG